MIVSPVIGLTSVSDVVRAIFSDDAHGLATEIAATIFSNAYPPFQSQWNAVVASTASR